MKIINIEAEQLRSMKNKEGLVIQGCGGDLQKWADGINDMLTEADILKNKRRFEKCYVFENENAACMLFPFENVRLDIGKLAMWRLQTHEQFGGKWLSDYVPNRLGGFVTEQKKPSGKKALRDTVLSRFPMCYERYIEVFGGAGWVTPHSVGRCRTK